MNVNRNNISTHLFNPRLFLEALKRLRVIGLVTAILSVTISALVPIVSWMLRAPKFASFTVDTRLLCFPVALVVFMAPLFFSTLFSFLQKRKESDFFHAIPYTRTCVYISFTAAALAFVFAIQAACGLVAGMIWSMTPNLTFDLGGMIAYIFICMLAAAMLSSFMMLALTVSGTSNSCTLLFVLFAGFVRVVCGIFLSCVSSIHLIPTETMDFFVPTWFLPISVVYYFGEIESASAIIYSFSNILYSFTVTLGVFALAGFFYCKRKSEMAGNPAPGVRTQALFRILFTLPLALVIPLCLITGSAESTLLLVLTVITLLVYFLYELITTKRPKNMLRAIPGLAFVAGACILFSLLFHGYRTVVLYEKIDTEDIKGVSVDADLFGITYQGRLMETYRTDDEEIRTLIADQLTDSQARERLNERGSDYWERRTVTLHLKGGRTIQRNVILDDKAMARIIEIIREEEDVRELLYKIPDNREISTADVNLVFYKMTDYRYFNDEDELAQLMKVFREEFNSLTDAQKDRVMNPTFLDKGEYAEEETIQLVLNGTVKGRRFRSRYIITEDMPLTRRHLLILSSLSEENWFSDENDGINGIASTILEELDANLERNSYEKLSVGISGFPALGTESADSKDHGKIIQMEGTVVDDDILQEMVALLAERNRIKPGDEPYENLQLTEDTYYVHLYIDGESSKNRFLSVTVSGLYELTEDDWMRLGILFEKGR